MSETVPDSDLSRLEEEAEHENQRIPELVGLVPEPPPPAQSVAWGDASIAEIPARSRPTLSDGFRGSSGGPSPRRVEKRALMRQHSRSFMSTIRLRKEATATLTNHRAPVEYYEFSHAHLTTREDGNKCRARGPEANLSTLNNEADAAVPASPAPSHANDGAAIRNSELHAFARQARASAQAEYDIAEGQFSQLPINEQSARMRSGGWDALAHDRPMSATVRWFHLPGTNDEAMDVLASCFELEQSVVDACRHIVSKPSISFHRRAGSRGHTSHLFIVGHYVLPSKRKDAEAIQQFKYEQLLLVYQRDLNILITVDARGKKSWEDVIQTLQIPFSKVRVGCEIKSRIRARERTRIYKCGGQCLNAAEANASTR